MKKYLMIIKRVMNEMVILNSVILHDERKILTQSFLTMKRKFSMECQTNRYSIHRRRTN